MHRDKAGFQQLVERTTPLPPEAWALIQVLNAPNPSQLADTGASFLKPPARQRRELQATDSFAERPKKLSLLLGKKAAAPQIPNGPPAG